jgi:hypothetical protein
MNTQFVIPAYAGTQKIRNNRVPACAGMTSWVRSHG